MKNRNLALNIIVKPCVDEIMSLIWGRRLDNPESSSCIIDLRNLSISVFYPKLLLEYFATRTDSQFKYSLENETLLKVEWKKLK